MLDLLTYEAAKPGRPSLNGFSPEEIQAQMDRMLSSKLFKGSRRLSRFLRFTVEQTLAGERDRLKEYCIGLEVFEKPESFDPRMDSIVRVMARRLRILVNTYYNTDGRDDTLEIHFDSGSYVPTFLPRVPGATKDVASNGQAIPELLVIRADSDVIRELATCLLGPDSAAPEVNSAVAQVSSNLGGGLTAYDGSKTTGESGLMALYVSAAFRQQIAEALAAVGAEVMTTRSIQPEELQLLLQSALIRRRADSTAV
ncbi:MAG TPA: hypothetical protein VE621_21555 [Bryobacteraceae bacterium]|jgi:hypothetical protein|nr:hypothetical protein [Bryobacteraceae bacterium]